MIFDHDEYNGHKAVHFIEDADTRLRAIVALHNTTLGPAFGGCRAYHYASGEAALRDVLRLSRGMTFKNAAAGVPYGGGKSVILTDGSAPTRAQRLAYARAINMLGGNYLTAEDVGTSTADVAVMAEATPHFRNLPLDDTGKPAPFTARGVFAGMVAGWKHVAGADLAGAVVAVEGLGAVGMELCRLLTDAGAALTVCDVDPNLQKHARERFNAKIGVVGELHAADADIYAPCALGGTLHQDSIPKIKAKLVAGGANNQLAKPSDNERLAARGITYCPDFVINAGGVLSVAPIGEAFDSDAAFARAETIGGGVHTQRSGDRDRGRDRGWSRR